MGWIRTISEQDFMDRVGDAFSVEDDPTLAQLTLQAPEGQAPRRS